MERAELDAHLPGFHIRTATSDDDEAIVGLLAKTLGWNIDSRHRELFSWKHRENPFGSSPTWVAEDEQGLIGSRTFMKWNFRLGAEVIPAIRAVDTATDPRAQGRGVFRALTLRGIQECMAEGAAWAFNTPNDKSAPGYMKMGWRVMGRLPANVRPNGMLRLSRLRATRDSAELWSLESNAGEDASEILRQTDDLGALLAEIHHPTGRLRTARTIEFLQWRYGSGPVRYRVLPVGRELSEGIVVFRLRRRGTATEVLIADVIMPESGLGQIGSLFTRVVKMSGADYGVCLGTERPRGWLPTGQRGPVLTWRLLARGDYPSWEALDLRAGDVELF